jgi:hypothetical protein
MNRRWVIQNLTETIEHIQSAIDRIEDGGGEAALEAGIISAYLDLNRAWNGRNCRSIPKACADERLVRFPADLPGS